MGRVDDTNDEIICRICSEPLRYDRITKEWRTKYGPEGLLVRSRCFDRHNNRWDHEPRKNVGRLIRAVKKIDDKKRMGLG